MKLLLISGSTRTASTNAAALRSVRTAVPDGWETAIYAGLSDLPAFNPDGDGDVAVQRLREQIDWADAVVFSTPEYAGTLPGSLKNLLDWTVGGGELNEKPCGVLNVAATGRGAGAAEHLRMVLRYVDAQILEGVDSPVGRDDVGPDGLVDNPAFQTGAAALIDQLIRAVRE
ncbi:NAD(P)H-dependent FMN reductase [Antricoccus suffuscus]|uniref:NAD(P)H-dependent FMN reductase n=1 Tax=Antricoccus suffuscus TaxID=1629062 RepID=A0A2T1A6K4_9ACTN|nr:NADPH-dependent FMN reductase [Antricoccus suffuscus]PRZ44107.1 NAD(P)H-dependent FMN reductase [Antricoccus suffuscus]